MRKDSSWKFRWKMDISMPLPSTILPLKEKNSDLLKNSMEKSYLDWEVSQLFSRELKFQKVFMLLRRKATIILFIWKALRLLKEFWPIIMLIYEIQRGSISWLMLLNPFGISSSWAKGNVSILLIDGSRNTLVRWS